jgi:hypothetical protein
MHGFYSTKWRPATSARVKEGEMRRCGLFLAMVLSVTILLVPTTQAAEEVAGWSTGHTQKSEMMEVGDVPGHLMGVSQFHGLSYYTKGPDKGEMINRMGTTNFDVEKGKGTSTGYEVKTFNDGSTVVLKFSGTQIPINGGKKTAMEGRWEVAGGTGRYAGAKGSGTYKTLRIGDFKTGSDTYSDFTGTLTTK